MRSSLALVCIRSAALAIPLGIVIACGSTGTGGGFTGTGTGNTTGSSGSGSTTGSSGGTTGSGVTTGSSGATTGKSGATTGTTGTTTGTTGTTAGTTGTTTGTTGTTTGTTGTTTGTTGTAGASGTGVTVVDAGPSACGTPAANVLSDFEQDVGILLPQPGRNGWWYVFSDSNGGSPVVPASVPNGPIGLGPTVAPIPARPTGFKTLAGETCNDFSLHSSATGHTCPTNTASTCYAGTGATFAPGSAGTKSAYSLAAYDGIQFDIATPSGSQGPVDFEVLTKESQPGTVYAASHPGTVVTGTAVNSAVDAFNTRGYILSAVGTTPTGTSTALSTSWTTVYVPFSQLVPFYFPQPSSCGTTPCQAPEFVPGNGLGFQFSIHDDFSTTGAYDLWIDNVALYTGDNGLNPANPTAAVPAFNDGAKGWSASCAKPTFMGGSKTAAGKYLLWAYRNWKNGFVRPNGSSQMVISPEVNGGSVVSEGIAYGMLIAAYMGDQTLFDGLNLYWTNHAVSGHKVMTWRFDITGNNMTGSGSATDADQDAAWALYAASKIFTTNASTYATASALLINDIWAVDFDHTNLLPTFGSNNTSSNPTNPSYFAPAYYPVFGLTNAAFNTVAASEYAALNRIGGTLPPAWCTGGNCSAAGSGGVAPTNDMDYQYDAHRVPWRVGLDFCWSTPTASMASAYLGSHIIPFFAGQIASPGGVGGGIDALYDEYTATGSVCTTCTPPAAPNSMSLIGSASVGAMVGGAANSAFVNGGWQFVLDGLNRGKPNVDQTKNAYYTYFNSTVGLLTALSLSGNFYKL